MDKYVKISTSIAKPGMAIGKDIYSPSGNLIAGVGTKLTDRMITQTRDSLLVMGELRRRRPFWQIF